MIYLCWTVRDICLNPKIQVSILEFPSFLDSLETGSAFWMYKGFWVLRMSSKTHEQLLSEDMEAWPYGGWWRNPNHPLKTVLYTLLIGFKEDSTIQGDTGFRHHPQCVLLYHIYIYDIYICIYIYIYIYHISYIYTYTNDRYDIPIKHPITKDLTWLKHVVSICFPYLRRSS